MSFLERIFDRSGWEEKRRIQKIEQGWEEIEQGAQEERPLIEENIEKSGIVSLLEDLRDETPGAVLKVPEPKLIRYEDIEAEERPVRLTTGLTVEPSGKIVPCSIFYLGILGHISTFDCPKGYSIPARYKIITNGIDPSLSGLPEGQFLIGVNVKVLPDKISIETKADCLEFREHIQVQATYDALNGRHKRTVKQPPWFGLKDSLVEMFNQGVENCAIVDFCRDYRKSWKRQQPLKPGFSERVWDPREIELFNRGLDEFLGRR